MMGHGPLLSAAVPYISTPINTMNQSLLLLQNTSEPLAKAHTSRLSHCYSCLKQLFSLREPSSWHQRQYNIYGDSSLKFHTQPFFLPRWSGRELVQTRVLPLCPELGLPSGSQEMWPGKLSSHSVSPCNSFSKAFFCSTYPCTTAGRPKHFYTSTTVATFPRELLFLK